MSFPINLPSTSTREAIIDALYRAVLGIDTADSKLFESAFYQNSTFDLNGNIMDGLAAINANCYDGVSKLDTTHFLSNIRVNLASGSETKAVVTASALAQHYRPGQGNEPNTPQLMGGSLYFMDVEKDAEDSVWKIRNWKMKLIWTSGDWSVLTGE